eukprot:symbB.v1.2.011444.t2/scaffold762.1/size178242/5
MASSSLLGGTSKLSHLDTKMSVASSEHRARQAVAAAAQAAQASPHSSCFSPSRPHLEPLSPNTRLAPPIPTSRRSRCRPLQEVCEQLRRWAEKYKVREVGVLVLGLASLVFLLTALSGPDPQPFAAVIAALLGWLTVYTYMLQAECLRLTTMVQIIQNKGDLNDLRTQERVDIEMAHIYHAHESSAQLGGSRLDELDMVEGLLFNVWDVLVSVLVNDDSCTASELYRQEELVVCRCEGEVYAVNTLFPEFLMKLSPLLSVQDFAQLRATCSQPQVQAFQQLLSLPSQKRRLLVRVERVRSAEQWAELADQNANKQWNKKSKQKVVYNMLGSKHHFTPTGSVFDGWKEYLLCTSMGCCPPDVKPALYEDLVFRDWPKDPVRSSLDVACAIGGLILLPSEQVNALGWSIQAPLFCVLIRLIWLLLRLVLAKAANRASRAGRARSVSRIEHILHEAFPYVAYVPLAVLCLVRLISDPPKAPHDSNARFWTFLVFGFLCSLGENYMSLAEIHRFQSTEPQSLGIELLSTDGSNGTAGSESGSGESENAAKKKDSVWKLLNLVAKEWPLLIQASICLLVAAISDVLIPHYISETISEIILAEEQGKLADRPYKRPVICLLIAAGSSAVFSACRGGTFIVIGGRLAKRLRCTLFAALMQQEIGFFDTTQIGELTSRMTQDCQQVVEQAYLNVNVFLRTLVSIITTLAFMFSITTPLTCVAFVSVPAVVAISMKYSNIFRQISENAQKSLADANAVANEGLGNMSTLRSFAAEDLEMQRFGVAMGVYRKLMKKRAMFYLVYFTSTMMLPQAHGNSRWNDHWDGVVTAVVLFYGGKLTLEGQMRAKSLLSFVFYLQTLNNNFSTLGDFYTNMIQAAGAAVRVFELRERQPDAPMSGELKPAQDQGVIEM